MGDSQKNIDEASTLKEVADLLPDQHLRDSFFEFIKEAKWEDELMKKIDDHQIYRDLVDRALGIEFEALRVRIINEFPKDLDKIEECLGATGIFDVQALKTALRSKDK